MPYLPASFDGTHGRVNYWCKVVIERPWKDIDISKNFSVIGQLDLNTDPDAKVLYKLYNTVSIKHTLYIHFHILMPYCNH